MRVQAVERIERSRRIRSVARPPIPADYLRQVARMPPSKSRQSCESLIKELRQLQDVRRNLQEQVEMKKKQVHALNRFIERLGPHAQEEILDMAK